MPNDRANPYAIPDSTTESMLARAAPSLQLAIFINFATWAFLLAIPVTLSVFTFTIPTETVRVLYERFNFWQFLPFYFVTLSAVNFVLHRHAHWQRHAHIQFLVLIGAALALIPFVFVMLVTDGGPW